MVPAVGPAGGLTGRTPVELDLEAGRYSVCRLEPGSAWPTPRSGVSVYSVTRTPDEISVVCGEAGEPPGSRVEPGWRIFRIAGPIAFDLVGVVASVAVPLAGAQIAVFVVSTYDTDLVLVKDGDADRAVDTLTAAGHRVSISPGRPPDGPEG